MNFPTTPTPNIIYDTYLPILTESQLKVLMIVVRQTLGWVDFSTGKRKKWDRITLSQFVKKTGLSARSVSPALQVLVDMEVIEIRNGAGRTMSTPKERRRTHDLYYAIGRAIIEGEHIIRWP